MYVGWDGERSLWVLGGFPSQGMNFSSCDHENNCTDYVAKNAKNSTNNPRYLGNATKWDVSIVP